MKLKWGIIGLGKIAHKFASDLQLSNKDELYAVASRDEQKASDFCRKYDAQQSFDSYEELIKDSETDIVYIATPHVFHYKYSKLCLENGKHVLCEKPLGMNAKEVESLIAIAKSKNLFLMEGLWTRFIPAFEKVLSILKSGEIGNPLFLRADFGFKANKDPNGRLFNKELGGGSILDIGIYPIYMSLMVFGKPLEIKSTARFTDQGIDSYCAMLFKNENDTVSSLESTFEADTPIEAHIYGSKGKIILHYQFHNPEKISIHIDGEAEITEVKKYRGEGYIHEIEEVNESIALGRLESEKHSLQDSLDLVQIMDKIRKEIGLKYKQDMS